MDKTPVIRAKNLPTRWPIFPTAVLYLLLDRFHAPGYAWGIAGTCAAIIWIAVIVAQFTETPAEPEFKRGPRD